MRLYPLLGLALVSLSLSAQTTSQTSAVVLQAVPTGTKCPVEFSVTHAGRGGLVETDRSAPSPERSYSVLFGLPFSRPVAQAKVTLFGATGTRLVPAGSKEGSHDVTESFTLTPSAEGRRLYRSVVYTDRITALQWVQLREITYADGSKWHETPGDPCRVAPNGFMLVAQRQ